jgi:nucleotide-binding universal stress UspA family protein
VDETLRADTEEAMEPFATRGVACDVVITHSDPRSALIDIAASAHAGLIVVGRRGEGQFRGLGGTTSYLVRHSPIPLAVIP